MKFIQVADVHLGAKPLAGSAYSSKRGQEIWTSFQRIIELCEEEQTDILLIAGDLFHRQPLLRELKEVNSLFATLTHTKVVLIVGNHDYLKPTSFYRNFEWESHVYPLLAESMEAVEFPEYNLAVYGSSYHQREDTLRIYETVRIKDKQRYHILLAHGGDEKHRPFQKHVLDRLGFDYIALGHIHKPQELVRNRMAYSGALEPIDINDYGAHGYIQGVIDKRGCKTEFVPFATREYIPIEIEVDEEMTNFQVKTSVQRTIEEDGRENLYKVCLEGFRAPEIIFDIENMDLFGNIVEIHDYTKPAYDFWELFQRNKGNLLGNYIESFGEAEPGSVEYEALCIGVQALMGIEE